MSKRKRHDNIDTRLSQRAVDLFRLGKHMLARGYANELDRILRSLQRASPRPSAPTLDAEHFRLRNFRHEGEVVSAPRRPCHGSRTASKARGGDGVRGSELAPFYYIKSGTARCLLNVRFPA